MESLVGRDLPDRHHIADLGEELVPPLMREHLAGRTAFDRSSVRDRIPELRIVRVGSEVGVIRQPFRRPLAQGGGEGGVAVGVAGHRHRVLEVQPGQRRGEPLRAEQRTARRAGRDLREGARGEWTQAVLQRQRSGRSENSPFVEITPRDLTDRTRLDDLRPIVAGLLCFSLSNA